ncbi:hypothetical protein ACPPVV_15645 [Rhodanobacter sp. Col0626]|uniref:hypothetical protein n=1 Tax=Rhodanobacter sp. Col0626 TaxID=3415679 RepID=UPI003CF9AACC
MHYKLIAAAVACVLGTICSNAHANDLNDIFAQGHVDGEIRAYNFNRIYETNTVPDASALAGSVLINARTGTFGGGFSLVGSLASANSFGSQSNNTAKVDASLMGLDDSVSALSQAYLQYENHWLTFRGGYQYLATPWMGMADSRVIPASYEALSVDVKPADGWDIYGIRSFGWKSRTSSGYTSDNLYYPSTYDGDTMYGNNGALPATARSANGAWAFGTSYTNGGLKTQAWYYNFMRFARLGYVDGSYTFKTGTGFDPFVAAQYVTETGGSDNILVDTRTRFLGLPGDRVKSKAWGANVGVVIPNGRLEVAYNKIAQQDGAIGSGALISPYTVTYAADPLYTTSMLRGLVEQGPGHAWKAKVAYNLFDQKLQLAAAYTKYTTDLRGDSHDLYFDIIYKLDGYLKGLSLRDRWERSSGGINNLNPGNESFTYNRLMIDYKF